MTGSGQVSLLRGINVGGHALVPMAQLRAIYGGMDLDDVRTHLQSGNVVFRSERSPDAIAAEAEAALKREFGFAIRVLGRRHEDIARIGVANPFPDADPSRHVVVFLSVPPPADLRTRLEAVATTGETVHLGQRELHILFPEGIGRSRITNAVIERNGVVGTGRNWRTVMRLSELTAPSG